MKEYRSYHPENIAIENFMNPATDAFKPWFNALSYHLEDIINGFAVKQSGDQSVNLQMGTEIELNIFSRDFDTRIHQPEWNYKNPSNNPNYRSKHLNAVMQIENDIIFPREQNGLDEILFMSGQEKITTGRIFFEMRTVPGDVETYISQMEEIKDWFQGEAYARSVRPAIYSQHIHFSLQGDRSNLLTEKSKSKKYVDKALLDIYQRALPALRLPEEINGINNHYCIGKVVKTKGSQHSRQSDIPRVEARVNSSEYAFDPYLNLSLHLLGLKRGLEAMTKFRGYKKIDEDKPLEEIKKEGFGFSTTDLEYEDLLDDFVQDRALLEYFPSEVLQSLYEIFMHHDYVSRGKMSVRELKRIADSKAFALDPDMYISNKG